MVLEPEHLTQINNLLAKQLGITSSDPCYCGSTKKYLDCCDLQPNFWMSESYFQTLIGFAKHNNFAVKSIPSTFFNNFNHRFLKKFNICANPNCQNGAIGSHIFGESLVRKHFNSEKCQWFLIEDDGIKRLNQAGISNDIKYPIFCGKCDNSLFKSIDVPEHNLSDQNNIHLHLFRCMSFQYQYTRANLALAHQLAFGSVKIMFARQSHTGNFKKNEQINIDHLIMSFVGYKYHTRMIDRLSEICIGNKTSNNLKIYTRVLTVKNPVFAQGILNPKYDLLGDSIKFVKDAGIMYVVLPKDSNSVSITIATIDDEYGTYITQLDSLNSYELKKLVNGFISPKNTQYNLLLSMEYKAHQKSLR
jgi:hypothetical protein